MGVLLDATRILSCATGVPPRRFTQDEVFRLLGYTSPRIRRIFLNSDIEYRHFWPDPDTFTPHETPDQLHARYREASMRHILRNYGNMSSPRFFSCRTK